jgi:hypothetical protein
VDSTRVYFKQPLFRREALSERWDVRHKLVSSQDELAQFYRTVEEDPRLKEIEPDQAVAQEMLEFYNAVVVDGRYIYDLREGPERVAKELGLQPSGEALELVSRAARMTGEQASNDITIAVAVAIVIVCAVPGKEAEVVVDWTQQVELKL